MKRSRAPNFTNAEIMLLLRLVEKYPIIENKKTDGVTAKEKHEAWQSLASEYNSQTSYSPRIADNLMACYKNQKIKVKKMHSSQKMAFKAPVLLQAVEDHGQDWERVAQATNETSTDCQNSFKSLVTAAKKEEASHKREINRTGGGQAPLPSCSNSDRVIIEKVKTLIGPSLKGLYTIYDGDADFMKEQQLSLPTESQLYPIEDALNCTLTKNENDCTPLTSNKNMTRLNLMKKKIDPSLETIKKGKRKPVSASFQELADDKKELVQAQKKLIAIQLEQQQLNLDICRKKFECVSKAVENVTKELEINMEKLEFLKQSHNLQLKKQEIELELLMRK